jgi:bifunctional N-acetylglutamate synthase/kinase
MPEERRPVIPFSDKAKGYDLVIDFFSNIGLSREASMYLKMFRTVVPWQFAVLLISAESLRKSWRTVALDLAYLNGLSLHPVIVLDNLRGGEGSLVQPSGPPPAKAARPGVRIRSLTRMNSRLVSAVFSAGGRAVGIYNQLFSLGTPLMREPDFDFRLLVSHIDLVPIKSAVHYRQIPVISPLAMDNTGRVSVISAEKAAKALCARIRPQKFIVIGEREGVLDRSGRLIRNIMLSTDYEQLVSSGRLDEQACRQIDAAARLLHEVPDLTVQFASAGNLISELFTVKGRGTYIRLGHEILTADSYGQLDTARLRELLEDGFGKQLVEDYFETQPHRVFYERNYHGLIVVKPLDGDIYYLDKFVVGRQWQGEGVGAPLWRELTKYYSKVIWRANPQNPINRWYIEQADGFQRTESWNIYWIGLTPDEVGRLITRVSSIPRTVV